MSAKLPIQGVALDEYLPHRGAMRLIDRVIAVDEDHAVAEVDVPLDGLFVHDAKVPAWVGIEYMAQTVAAWAGARALRTGGAPRVGYLLGSRRYSAQCDSFAGGSTLRIEARCELIGDNGLGQFDCSIRAADGSVLAGAMVSVFEPPLESPPQPEAPPARDAASMTREEER
jgi:predicted hotdog family 3-hydroxylacyl-ACP dehydratase